MTAAAIDYDRAKNILRGDNVEERMELASNATMREQWHMLDAEIEVAQESLQRAERESMIRYPEWKQKVIEQGIQPTAGLTAAMLKEFREWLSEDSTPTDAVKEEKIRSFEQGLYP